MQRGKSLEKDASRVPYREALLMALFFSIKTVACKPPSTPDLGAFVRAQIEAQGEQPTPISVTTPDGTNCRVWLASISQGNRIIADDGWWRVNVIDLFNRRPAFAEAHVILRTNDDGTYHVTIDYNGNHKVIACS
jgi:hypothetical protein